MTIVSYYAIPQPLTQIKEQYFPYWLFTSKRSLYMRFLWNRNLSVVLRPSVSQLSLKLMNGFLSDFGCCFPWAIPSDVFWIKKNWIFYEYFLFALIWDPMRTKNQNATPPTNRSRNFSNVFWILKNEVLTNFICFHSHGAQWEWKYQNATPSTNCSQTFETCPEFSS